MLLIGVLVVAALVSPSQIEGSPDIDLMNALQESLQESETLIITMKNIKHHRKVLQDSETLLSLVGKNSESLFVIKLSIDRGNKRIIIETNRERRHIKLSNIQENKSISSLVIAIDQTGKQGTVMSVYADCSLEGKINLSEKLKELVSANKGLVKVIRDRRYITDLDSDTQLNEVLKRLKCLKDEPMLSTQPQPADETLQEDYMISHTRGDIPIMNDCDDNLLIKTMNRLIGVINKLEEELKSQQSETRNLRKLLEQCDVCRPGEGY